MAMMPKRVKFRKSQKGRVKGNATRGNYVAFGEFGLQALEPARISAEVLEAGRTAASRLVRGAAAGRRDHAGVGARLGVAARRCR